MDGRHVARNMNAKGKDGVFGAAGDLDTACENCHQTFWYPEPGTK